MTRINKEKNTLFYDFDIAVSFDRASVIAVYRLEPRGVLVYEDFDEFQKREKTEVL